MLKSKNRSPSYDLTNVRHQTIIHPHGKDEQRNPAQADDRDRARGPVSGAEQRVHSGRVGGRGPLPRHRSPRTATSSRCSLRSPKAFRSRNSRAARTARSRPSPSSPRSSCTALVGEVSECGGRPRRRAAPHDEGRALEPVLERISAALCERVTANLTEDETAHLELLLRKAIRGFEKPE